MKHIVKHASPMWQCSLRDWMMDLILGQLYKKKKKNISFCLQIYWI